MAVKVFKFLHQPLCTVPMNDVIGYCFTSVMLRPAGYKAIGLQIMFDEKQVYTPLSSAVDCPVITTQPVNQLNVVPGRTITFMVEATGSDLTYQWQRNGGNLTDGATYSGTTTDTLTVMNVMEADEGNFTCVVTNVLDSVTSSAAQLTVRTCVCVCLGGKKRKQNKIKVRPAGSVGYSSVLSQVCQTTTSTL